jgi:hypothetical protein
VKGYGRRLLQAGIGAGDKVGVRIPSGTNELYVAILATLSVGAAYVPPWWPAPRGWAARARCGSGFPWTAGTWPWSTPAGSPWPTGIPGSWVEHGPTTTSRRRPHDAAIARAGGVDVQLLGIGHNGHLAFNEPGSSQDSRTRVEYSPARSRQTALPLFSSCTRTRPSSPMKPRQHGSGPP